MRLTAQLALQQVKGNRTRTMGTVVATVLSTALLTAIMCFVSSGYEMLRNFLGPDMGEYGPAYKMILLIPAIFLGLLIAFMSVTVISNIYESSADKRLGEFGVLKCVGATKKQIKETVIFESLWISLVAIPIGLLVGTLIGYMGVGFAGGYVDYFSELSKSIVMRPFSFSLDFHVSLPTYFFAAVFSMTVVLISSGKPAKKSGKISAIECVKGISDRSIQNLAVKDKEVLDRLFGYEGNLGYKNVKRNKTAYKSTVRALGLSITLMLLLGSLSRQANGILSWMGSMGNDMLVDYTSIMEDVTNENTGKPQTIIAAPLPYEVAEEITEKLREYPEENFSVVGVGSDRETYKTIPDNGIMSEEFLALPKVLNSYNEIKTELVMLDRMHYEMYCEKAGVPVGSNILINNYDYNENGYRKSMVPFLENADQITLINAANEETPLSIAGMLKKEDIMDEALCTLAPDPIRIIVPTGDSRYFTWYSDPSDDMAFAEYARGVMDEYYPITSADSYVEQGYSVRISRADQMIKVMNIAIVLGEILLTGLIILLVIMGFGSVISTLSSNIRIRKKEFAVLKSIGMTRGSLERMIFCESLYCAMKASIRGLMAGIALPWLINLSIRKAFPVRYELPVMALMLGIISVFAIVLFVTKTEIRKLRGQNIIQDIRMDVM